MLAPEHTAHTEPEVRLDQCPGINDSSWICDSTQHYTQKAPEKLSDLARNGDEFKAVVFLANSLVRALVANAKAEVREKKNRSYKFKLISSLIKGAREAAVSVRGVVPVRA